MRQPLRTSVNYRLCVVSNYTLYFEGKDLSAAACPSPLYRGIVLCIHAVSCKHFSSFRRACLPDPIEAARVRACALPQATEGLHCHTRRRSWLTSPVKGKDRRITRLYVVLEGVAVVESAYISWARSLRSEICRQSLIGGRAYL
jgi:hypothetical protein